MKTPNDYTDMAEDRMEGASTNAQKALVYAVLAVASALLDLRKELRIISWGR